MSEIKVGDRVRATITGEATFVIDRHEGREYINVKYVDIDGDDQQASYVPLKDVVKLAPLFELGEVLNVDSNEPPDGTVAIYTNGEVIVRRGDAWHFAEPPHSVFPWQTILRAHGANELRIAWLPKQD